MGSRAVVVSRRRGHSRAMRRALSVAALAVCSCNQAPSTGREPPSRPAPAVAILTGRDLLAYMRATAPSAGSGPYDWSIQADEECVDGTNTPRTAVAGAACFSRWAVLAHQRAAALHAVVPPAGIEDAHAVLLSLIDAEDRALASVVTNLGDGREVDRRRGHFTWTQVWNGEGPEIPQAVAAAAALDTIVAGGAMPWVARMNRECDRVLRCVMTDAIGGGLPQVRCTWRSVADGLTGDAAITVLADVDSPLPVCDGTRVPCHDPPGGFRR